MKIDTGQIKLPFEDELTEEENENNRKYISNLANVFQRLAKLTNYDDNFYKTFIVEGKLILPITKEAMAEWINDEFFPYLKTLEVEKVKEITKELEKLKK